MTRVPLEALSIRSDDVLLVAVADDDPGDLGPFDLAPHPRRIRPVHGRG